jgi:hypothetical protein
MTRASVRAREASIYDLLVDRGRAPTMIRRVVLGLNWSIADVGTVGLCYSPPGASRTLSWPGTLMGRRAVINAVVNHAENACLARATPLAPRSAPHLAVFEHFTPRVRGANVVVIGRYPGLEAVWSPDDYVCLERRSLPGTLPESEMPRVLAKADWVFITASPLSNHTLPALLRHRGGAKVVLMGPSLPWLAEWSDFGVHYLAGVAVERPSELVNVVAEGGGTRIFEGPVGYRLLALV